jgi:two-component system C4-dicarboxylate transport sensor histidine kinase DctB
MTQRFMRRRRGARQRVVVVAGLVLVAGLVVWLTGVASLRVFLGDLKTRKEAALAVQAGALESLLDKYRLMTPLLARRPDIARMIEAGDRVEGDRIAAVAAAMSSAREVWFLDAAGAPVAVSPPPDGFPAPAPPDITDAFRAAMAGQLGREVLPGRAGDADSYVFASGVRGDRGLIGAVAVRVSLEDIERAWALSLDALVAIDSAGRIVASNVHDWRGLTYRPTDDRRTASMLFGLEPGTFIRQFLLVRGPGDQGGRPLMALGADLPILGWRVYLLADTAEAETQTANAMLIAFLVCIIAGGFLWSVIERQDAMVRRLRSDRAAALWLERRVHSRTRELTRANALLAEEVQERLQAEDDLRRTQADLVQAAKLATLGQMSAALSHEFNQPLAVISTHAENAGLLIARGQADKAHDNLNRITAMVQRMAEIARTLKGFTRRAGTDVQPVSLCQVVEEALLLVMPQAKRNGVPLKVVKPEQDVIVAGGRIRLEQVVVNLLTNALDAVAGQPDPMIEIRLTLADEVILEVLDNGPGIPDAVMDQIFDPFFTTKPVGEGLGLGLSIAYKIVHDFSGSLVASNRPEGGASFRMSLPLVEAASRAAE